MLPESTRLANVNVTLTVVLTWFGFFSFFTLMSDFLLTGELLESDIVMEI